MKHTLLLIFLFLFSFNLFSQRESQDNGITPKQDVTIRDLPENFVTIYPVPVKDNSFSIKSNKEISFIKITNIIGQDIYRVKYPSPLLFIKINLDNPRRGMYLVVILFSDNTRVVKKVMIENTD